MSPLLRNAVPNLADEITVLLGKMNEQDLVEQVPHLQLVGRCDCGDDFCATFYTAPPPKKAYGPNHQTLSLNPLSGMMLLDLVDRNIVCIEILWRDDIRSEIAKLFRLSSADKHLPESDHAD